ncbi:MAG TPA: hypothetical protein PKE40_09485 [Arachnia sp.]|nr:hypothetical protein [Arachnia sp.]HMT86572.1 hypothetical protein [Arachnia sp.]
MGIYAKIRSFFGRSQADDATGSTGSRTPAGPVRVDLHDYETPGGHMCHLKDWDTWQPADPASELPAVEGQRQHIDALIQQHDASGTLDGLVPDLLDREIHYAMDEVRRRIDSAHTRNGRTEQHLFEQAKLNQHLLGSQIEERERKLDEVHAIYSAAHEYLTGNRPAPLTHGVAAAPVLIDTQVARQEPQPEHVASPSVTEPAGDGHGEGEGARFEARRRSHRKEREETTTRPHTEREDATTRPHTEREEAGARPHAEREDATTHSHTAQEGLTPHPLNNHDHTQEGASR